MTFPPGTHAMWTPYWLGSGGAKGFLLGILMGTPLGLIIFQKSEPAALFTIALCSMWPTIINTISGVKSIPQEYWNVAKVLRLSRLQTFSKILVPATLPYMFTGYRLSLGIAWHVIVASEM